LNAARPVIADFAVALVLTSKQTQHTVAGLDVQFVAHAGKATAMRDSGLEALRVGVPAARSLPLLEAIASTCDAKLLLDYADDAQLMVTVFPVSGAISDSVT
jgi:hypothetical protein